MRLGQRVQGRAGAAERDGRGKLVFPGEQWSATCHVRPEVCPCAFREERVAVR